MAGSAFNPLQDAIAKYVNQADHGFSVGSVLKKTLGGYGLAKADTPENAEVSGIVMEVIDEDNFRLCLEGHIRGLSVTSDIIYWLSDETAGLMVDTPPSTPGHVQKPVLWTISTTEGYYKNMRGCVVPGTPAPAEPVVRPVYKVTLTRGSNNDYTGTIADYPTSYQQSPIYIFTTDSGNDYNGVETRVNINSLGWVNLRKRDVPQGASTKLGYYDISPGGQLPFVYDGTEFQLLTSERKINFYGQAYYESGDDYNLRRVVISDHPAAYASGYVYNLTFTDASPSSYTSGNNLLLRVNGLSDMPVMKRDSALGEFVKIDDSELKTNRLYQFVCDGTRMVLVNPVQKQCYMANSVDDVGHLIYVFIRDYPSTYHADSYVMVKLNNKKVSNEASGIIKFTINSIAEYPIMNGDGGYAHQDDFPSNGTIILRYNATDDAWYLVGHLWNGQIPLSTCELRLSFNPSDSSNIDNNNNVNAVYAVPHNGNRIALWHPVLEKWVIKQVDSARLWSMWIGDNRNVTSFVVDISMVIDTENNDTAQIIASALWSDDHTRTELLEKKDGVWVFSGMPDRRYIGTVACSSDDAAILSPDDIDDYISGGDESGTTPSEAFDGDPDTVWGSSQTGEGIDGVAYVGFDMGENLWSAISWFSIQQDAADSAVDGVKLYGSDDGSTWTYYGQYDMGKDDSVYEFAIGEWCVKRMFKFVAIGETAGEGGTPGSYNLLNEGTAISSGNGGSSSAANTTDSNAESYWESVGDDDEVVGEWVGIDFGESNEKVLRRIAITESDCNHIVQDTGDGTHKDVQVQYSDDGSTWTKLSEHIVPRPSGNESPPDPVNTVPTQMYFNNTLAKRYWAVSPCVDAKSPVGKPWRITKLSYYTYTAPTGGGNALPWRIKDITIYPFFGSAWNESSRKLWNLNNQLPVKFMRRIDAADITCDTNAFVCLGNELYNTGSTSGMRVDYVVGMSEAVVNAEHTLINIADSGNSYEGGHVGIGFNAVDFDDVENVADIDGCNPTVSGLQRYNQITGRFIGTSPDGTVGLNSLHGIVRTNNSSAETTFNCGANSGGLLGTIQA